MTIIITLTLAIFISDAIAVAAAVVFTSKSTCPNVIVLNNISTIAMTITVSFAIELL